MDTADKAVTAEWWHSDVSCAPEPPMGAMLQMVVAPPTGNARQVSRWSPCHSSSALGNSV